MAPAPGSASPAAAALPHAAAAAAGSSGASAATAGFCGCWGAGCEASIALREALPEAGFPARSLGCRGRLAAAIWWSMSIRQQIVRPSRPPGPLATSLCARCRPAAKCELRPGPMRHLTQGLTFVMRLLFIALLRAGGRLCHCRRPLLSLLLPPGALASVCSNQQGCPRIP